MRTDEDGACVWCLPCASFRHTEPMRRLFICALSAGALAGCGGSESVSAPVPTPPPVPAPTPPPPPPPPPAPAPTPPSGTITSPVAPINTGSRAEVVARWQDTYFDNTAFAWSGDVGACLAGDTTEAFKRAVLKRLNYYRAMAGLPGDLALDLAFSSKAQQAALMMDANDALSHSPPTGWACYSAEGAEAAGRSNLAYSNAPGRSVSLLDGYMQDRGANNATAGHRRWILYSRLATVGTGDAPQANVLWILGPGTTGDTAANVAVAWPPDGFVPRPLAAPTDRFSFSCPSADFSAASISMRNDSAQPLAVRVDSRRDNGFGDNTIVWAVDTTQSRITSWDRGNADTRLSVEISGVGNCSAGSSFNYSVTFVTP